MKKIHRNTESILSPVHVRERARRETVCEDVIELELGRMVGLESILQVLEVLLSPTGSGQAGVRLSNGSQGVDAEKRK